MSKILEQIQAAEEANREELEGVKNKIITEKKEVLSKAESVVRAAKRDADISFDSKSSLLKESLNGEKKSAMVSIETKYSSFLEKKSSFVEKGVSFLFEKVSA